MKIKDKKFWRMVERSYSSKACWLWEGTQDRYGYGRVVRAEYSNKPLKAHRYAFFLFYGRWPEGICRHACGKNSCVRPSHLFDNALLAEQKTQIFSGYFEDCAKAIRKRYVKGSWINGIPALAREYGISPSLVRRILDGMI